MATVQDIVSTALREIGVLAGGETATADDANDGLAALNRLVDQWGIERLAIYTITRATWAITSGTYTVAGTATQPRPGYLDHVSYVDATPTPDIEIPLSPFTDDGWATLSTKAMTATRPTHWHYEPTFPDGILTLYPAPTDAGLTGVLYVPQPVAQFATLSATIALPPGYQRMLVKNLAVELMPGYKRQPDPLLLEQARDSKSAVKRANVKVADLHFDGPFVGGGGWSIYTGP